MVFSHKARSIRLKEPVLPIGARHNLHELEINLITRTAPQIIDLDDYIGNQEGEFILGGNEFSRTSRHVIVRGSTLHAQLPFGTSGQFMQAKLNLDLVLFFDAVSGEVQFVKPSRQLALSCSNFTLESGSMLSAICLKKNGRLKKDTIDLNQHLGFEGETLRLGRTGFREAGVKGDESFWLDGLNLCGNFTGPLTHKGNLIVETCVDLAIHLENDDGKLVWKDEQNFLGHLFGRDGVIVQYLEPLPVIGLLTAFIHRIAGNDDEAGRAFVKSTGASIVYAGCLILSIVTVNPVGLGLIAAFLTPVAIKAEEHIANHTIGDVAIRDSIKRAANDYLKEIIVNSLAAGGAGPWLVRKIRNQRQAFEQEAKTLLDQSTKEVLGDYVSGNLSAAAINDAWNLVETQLNCCDRIPFPVIGQDAPNF